MTAPSRRFDGHLSSINAGQLKPMMRLWGASTQLRKDECIAVIRQPAVFEAIVTSPKLRHYLRGEVAPDLIVVDQTHLAAFEEQLRWAGLQVSGELTVKVRQW